MSTSFGQQRNAGDTPSCVKSILVLLGLISVGFVAYRAILRFAEPALVGSWHQAGDEPWFVDTSMQSAEAVGRRVSSVDLRLDPGPEIGSGMLTLHTTAADPRTSGPPLKDDITKVPLRWRRGSGTLHRSDLYLTFDIGGKPDLRDCPPLIRELRVRWSVTGDGMSLTFSMPWGPVTFRRVAFDAAQQNYKAALQNNPASRWSS